jgi:hypothetical protein
MLRAEHPDLNLAGVHFQRSPLYRIGSYGGAVVIIIAMM